MIDARSQIMHRFGRERFGIQSCECAIDVLHRPAQLLDQLASGMSQVIHTGRTRPIHYRVFREILLRRTGWGDHIDESIAQQSRTSHRELAALRNLYVFIYSYRYGHALAFAQQSRPARNPSNLRATKQNIRAFKQTAVVFESNRQIVVNFEAFAEPAEFQHEPSDHGQPDGDENADFKFEGAVAIHVKPINGNLARSGKRKINFTTHVSLSTHVILNRNRGRRTSLS